MKTVILSVVLLIASLLCFAQKTPKDYGYRHLQIMVKYDTVDVLIRSKKGEESIKKPLLFFIQGSLAKPLIKYNDKSFFFPSPLENNVEENYHMVIVNKPGLPLMVHEDSLSKSGQVLDKLTNKTPRAHTEKNYLEYYVARNVIVLDSLLKKPWVDKSRVIVAGHSEGSTIAAYMASENKNITHLIYSGGTPYYSRILSMVTQDRLKEKDSVNEWVEKDFSYWQDVVNDTTSVSRDHGWNSYKGTYSFSKNENEVLKNLKIPVLITYGTKDEACPFNDMFRIEVIKEKIHHITFKAYIGLEHNFFGLDSKGNIDPNKFNWDTVVKDWLDWIDMLP
ncbi:alpha/beta hydrolase family protein [Winogradskyella flava]|uniref:alpha/beta hydrolase family protein n=1 Tax=Winogradskyella flava TaxID=1884876 RepID=UPI00248F4919|nr:alpha/beta hydrolase [Winogradskyella flava]